VKAGCFQARESRATVQYGYNIPLSGGSTPPAGTNPKDKRHDKQAANQNGHHSHHHPGSNHHTVCLVLTTLTVLIVLEDLIDQSFTNKTKVQ